MKPESPFSKLPSISELLGHPAVTQVVKRVNQTTIAQRATSFLEELQTNLRHRWEQGHVPSLGQLAERFARRLLGPAQTALPAVNATGVVLGDRWPALPLAEPAIDEIVRLTSDYTSGQQPLVDRVLHSLRELCSAEAALVVHSYPVAREIARGITGSVEIARYAGFINPATYGLSPYATIAERLQSGAELVVVDGAGLIGGPACGILLGRKGSVESVATNPLGSQVPPNLFTLAGLAATLAIYQTNERVVHQIPLWQLLTAPLENLEQRCHRLASLISANEQIVSATPTYCDGTWCDSEEIKLSGPSWAIVVRPQTEAFDAVVANLREAVPQILARVQQEEIWLDLRGVFPRWDQHLVATIS
jgi:hypothetical protein